MNCYKLNRLTILRRISMAFSRFACVMIPFGGVR
jgi:hypothetical protein